MSEEKAQRAPRTRRKIQTDDVLLELVAGVARLEEGATNLRETLFDHTEQDASSFHELRTEMELIRGEIRSLKSNREVAAEAGQEAGKSAGLKRGTIAGGVAAGLAWGIGKLLGF